MYIQKDASSMVTASATANTMEGDSRASGESGCCVFTFTRGIDRMQRTRRTHSQSRTHLSV